MLLDASRSHDIGILVELGDKGHKGPSPFQVSRLAREAAGREARVVLRWNRAKVIANIDDLAISIWALKVIDKLSQIDDI